MSLVFRIFIVLICLLGLGCNPFYNPFEDFPESCTTAEDCPGYYTCVNGKCMDCAPGDTTSCYEGPDGTSGKGECKAGTQTCSPTGTWGPCQGQIKPTAQEVCGNNKDDNCNGIEDKDETSCSSCVEGTKQDCYTGPAATKDVGICKAGEQTCTGGKWGTCQNEITPAATETCGNNQDDNCDGVDDDSEPTCNTCKDGDTQACYSGPATTKGVGICKEGTQSCSGSQWGTCKDEVTPAAKEICTNGKDDDCNGKVDSEDPTCQCTGGGDCGSGDFCYIRPGDTTGMCLTPCKENGACTTEGAKCTQLGPGSATFCLKVTSDGKCDPKTFHACPANQYCDTDTCKNVQELAEGKSCDGYQNRCSTGLICAFLPQQGRCLKPCTGSCPGNEECVELPTVSSSTSSTKVCLKKCTSDNGCSSTEMCEKTDYTKADTYCIPKGNQDAWQTCQRGFSNCKKGLKCIIEEGGEYDKFRAIGYCTPQTCTPPPATCPNPESSLVFKKDYICAGHLGTSCLIPCANKPDICKKVPGFSCRTFPNAPAPYCAP
ncbi:MAG: hypothetical protein CL920_12465 [Deltaproteobacteria bacterium]|nr:hypothetical protein [Deltaproteobacteria bacterium]|tara:strand:- start:1474 stop:3105 length:1632 start_codon:yes stop_codon:yes gene_type:complete